MAFFECTIGGSSGDGVSLIAECSSAFAGNEITADNGEDSFTEVCPSSSPYTVKFEDIPIGTYTISGIAEGRTFTTEITILDYTTTLSSTPDGATATPTDDIQTWLHCAQIWDENYTTISEVLADTTTLLALISNSNAVDYMARSTTWANSVTADSTAMTYIGANNYCADSLISDVVWLSAIANSAYIESVLNTKVPIMTSDTTPSGQVIGTAWSGTPCWHAFRNGSADSASSFQGWSYENGILGAYIGYVFTQNTRVCVAIMGQRYIATAQNIEQFKLQYSTDGGTSWNDAGETQTATQNTTGSFYNETIPIANSAPKIDYWRIKPLSVYNGGSVVALVNLQLYGRTDV